MDRAGQLILAHALFFGGHNVAGQDRQYRAVHGHRDRYLVQRNAIEQSFHIQHTVDRHAGFADVPLDPRVIRVVTPVGRQIKGHRDTLTTSSQCLAVKRVRRLCGTEPGVLTDGPGAAGIHRGFDPAHIGRKARQAVLECDVLNIVGGVQLL